MNDFGIKLKILRKGKKLTQGEVAEQMGLNRSTISNYEIGRRMPSIKELKRFAEFYGVGLEYFGLDTKDEVFDLLSRARDIFQSDLVSQGTKQELYEEIMRLYLNLKQ